MSRNRAIAPQQTSGQNRSTKAARFHRRRRSHVRTSDPLTWRSDGEYRTYFIALRRMTSGERLKHQKKLRIRCNYGLLFFILHEFSLTMPQRALISLNNAKILIWTVSSFLCPSAGRGCAAHRLGPLAPNPVHYAITYPRACAP